VRSLGPPVGTTVAKTAVIEPYGTELGIGGEQSIKSAADSRPHLPQSAR